MPFLGKKKSSKDLKESSNALPPPPRREPLVGSVPPPAAKREPAPAVKVEPKRVAPPAPRSIVPPGTQRVLVVGKFVVMTADVDNCEAVIVQGNLDGNIKAKYIVVMKGGCMRGKVECEKAEVSGSFEGMEMTAHDELVLNETARLGGRTTYHRITVADGAILTGELVYKPARPDEPTAMLKDETEDVPEEAEVDSDVGSMESTRAVRRTEPLDVDEENLAVATLVEDDMILDTDGPPLPDPMGVGMQ